MASSDAERVSNSVALKAGRWLAGATVENPKPRSGRVKALSIKDLAKRLAERGDRIAVDRLQGFEELRIDLRTMERDAISRALGVDLRLLIALRDRATTQLATGQPRQPEVPSDVLALLLGDDQRTAEDPPQTAIPAAAETLSGDAG